MVRIPVRPMQPGLLSIRGERKAGQCSNRPCATAYESSSESSAMGFVQDLIFPTCYVRCLGVRLAGHAIEEKDAKGRAVQDETFLMLLNAHHEPRPFTLPAHKAGVRWQPVLDTAVSPGHEKIVALLKGGLQYDLDARSLALLRLHERPA